MLAPNATVSVKVAATGISMRSKCMFRMIEPRRAIALRPFVTVIMTSWKGTMAHARLSPTAPPGRSTRTLTSTR